MAESTKEQIIQTVMEMLGEGIPAQELTTRQIATRAGIGIGLVNYHFQTKENLIGIAVSRYTDKLIESIPKILETLSGTPKQRLKRLWTTVMDRVAAKLPVALIAIRRDMAEPGANDSTQRILTACGPLMMEVTGGDGYWSRLLGDILCFTFQTALLRADVLRSTESFDIRSASQRSLFVEDTIETLLQNII